ncbi:MAG: DCC1-like thiol-disulfide oxidoreductase family protein [Bacteroidales bacterium]|nr:DCC1-like thiol-disulfide oxidoreductase family protein [Bacteroidales bacterium]
MGNTHKPIVLFDGVCNLCNWWVNWLDKHDKKDMFRLAHLQSPAANQLFNRLNISGAFNSVVLITGENYYVRSEAVLRIFKAIGGVYKLFWVFHVLPRALRDKLYDYIARKRYQWFGREDTCQVPSPKMRKRFLPEAFGE